MKKYEKIGVSIPINLSNDAKTLAIIRGQNFSEFIASLVKVVVDKNAAVIKNFKDEQKCADDALIPIEKLNL